jgi:hypothetical protein
MYLVVGTDVLLNEGNTLLHILSGLGVPHICKPDKREQCPELMLILRAERR